MSCWGLWQSATSFFYPFTSCFVLCIVLCPFFSVWELVYGRHECVCSVYVSVCWILITLFVWERCYHSIKPPLLWYLLPQPPYLSLCVCHSSVLFTISPLLPILPLGRNTEQGLGGCPVPTFGFSHSHRKHTRAQTHSQHMHSVSLHCLIYIWAQVVH